MSCSDREMSQEVLLVEVIRHRLSVGPQALELVSL